MKRLWNRKSTRIVFTKCASSELKYGALREAVVRERQGALFVAESLVGRSSALSGKYALYSVRA